MTGKLLSTQEAARRAGVTAKTVGRWVDAGVLRALFTAGGHRRIAEADLEGFLASRQSLLATDVGSEVVVVLGTSRPATVQAFRMASERARLAARLATADSAFELGLLVGRLVPGAVVLDDPGLPAAGDVVAGLRRLAFPGRIIVLSDRRWTQSARPDDVVPAGDAAGAVAILQGLARGR
jgi:excisionase family DNA binding protein